MSDHIDTAKAQTRGIKAALNGDSSAMQRFHVEDDPNPARMLAVASAHTINALGAVISELEELRAEVEALRRQVRR